MLTYNTHQRSDISYTNPWQSTPLNYTKPELGSNPASHHTAFWVFQGLMHQCLSTYEANVTDATFRYITAGSEKWKLNNEMDGTCAEVGGNKLLLLRYMYAASLLLLAYLTGTVYINKHCCTCGRFFISLDRCYKVKTLFIGESWLKLSGRFRWDKKILGLTFFVTVVV